MDFSQRAARVSPFRYFFRVFTLQGWRGDKRLGRLGASFSQHRLGTGYGGDPWLVGGLVGLGCFLPGGVRCSQLCSVYLSFFLCVFLSVCVPFYLRFFRQCFFLSVSFYLGFFLSFCRSVYLLVWSFLSQPCLCRVCASSCTHVFLHRFAYLFFLFVGLCCLVEVPFPFWQRVV